MTDVRTGLGWDSHRFKAGRPLILGGVTFDGAQLGLDGHSDADVLTHAVMDALLGAAGLGDIGMHFPDSDGAYEGADSIALLREVLAAVADAGWRVVHVDTTVLMERPKIGPYRAAIRASLAAALGLELEAVNVKASTGEGMGFVGRLEGVAALAVATVQRRSAEPGEDVLAEDQRALVERQRLEHELGAPTPGSCSIATTRPSHRGTSATSGSWTHRSMDCRAARTSVRS